MLIWELVSGQDITEMQPLAIARQMHVSSRPSFLLYQHCCLSRIPFLLYVMQRVTVLAVIVIGPCLAWQSEGSAFKRVIPP